MRYEISGEKIQKKRQITAREYIELIENLDETKKKIIKTRQCFIYDSDYFMVETFLNVENNPSILRVDRSTESSKTKLPPALNKAPPLEPEVEGPTTLFSIRQFVNVMVDPGHYMQIIRLMSSYEMLT